MTATTDLATVAAARYALILSELPEDLHGRAKANSWTLGNIRGGRPSDNLRDAAAGRPVAQLCHTQGWNGGRDVKGMAA